MNSKCKAMYENGFEVNIKYFRGLRQIETTVYLEACSLDCAFAAQAEHGEKSAIYEGVLQGKDLAILNSAISTKTAARGLRS